MWIATGIANIYARDALAMAAGAASVAEAFPGRFCLGLGVSHRELVEGMRGHNYGPPLRAMEEYLDRMGLATQPAAAPPAQPAPRVLAAMGPKMLDLARRRADGAHPYLVPAEHTARAREALGPDRLLAPEQTVIVETERSAARALGRAYLANYFGLENYLRSWARFGFTDEDFTGEGSDRLVDAIIAWGSPEDIAARVREHLDAGADHVAIQVVVPGDVTGETAVPLAEWRELGAALFG
jgi:probable F420-dependent oxidoreductase